MAVILDSIARLDRFLCPALADEFDRRQFPCIVNNFLTIVVGHCNVVTTCGPLNQTSLTTPSVVAGLSVSKSAT